MFPERGCVIWLGRMDEKKRRLIDYDVIGGLINNFEARQWLNGVMEEGICASSKPIARRFTDRTLDPVLDLANKTALPKTLQP